METLETSQCHISLGDLVADDELNELHFDIVNTFDRTNLRRANSLTPRQRSSLMNWKSYGRNMCLKSSTPKLAYLLVLLLKYS
ncbi:hypothetical protein BFJ66_g4535 [Fusarium oxysporum f. sp. cepae]|nr:hypothetical protein BFJ66_g4535 [Fusarium oxysporum f. sp. cepae]